MKKWASSLEKNQQSYKDEQQEEKGEQIGNKSFTKQKNAMDMYHHDSNEENKQKNEAVKRGQPQKVQGTKWYPNETIETSSQEEDIPKEITTGVKKKEIRQAAGEIIPT